MDILFLVQIVRRVIEMMMSQRPKSCNLLCTGYNKVMFFFVSWLLFMLVDWLYVVWMGVVSSVVWMDH